MLRILKLAMLSTESSQESMDLMEVRNYSN